MACLGDRLFGFPQSVTPISKIHADITVSSMNERIFAVILKPTGCGLSSTHHKTLTESGNQDFNVQNVVVELMALPVSTIFLLRMIENFQTNKTNERINVRLMYLFCYLENKTFLYKITALKIYLHT